MSMETITMTHDVKAIKDHKCDFCGQKIPIGETYRKSTHKFDGEVYDWKTHKYCEYLADKLNMYEDADEGVTGDMFCDIVSNYHDDLLTELLPEDKHKEYGDIIRQLRHVRWIDKWGYVLRHFLKHDKQNQNPPTP